MARCPDCGYTADASYEWVESIATLPDRQPSLVVCPDCDVVLGGLAHSTD